MIIKQMYDMIVAKPNPMPTHASNKLNIFIDRFINIINNRNNPVIFKNFPIILLF